MATYSAIVLDEIRAGIDIVDLVGRFVNLKKAGVNWKGLCPFHGEKTPSFTVNPKKGIFHCFGCGVGGDAFGFLMRQDKLTFPEAVRALAKQANVALPEDRSPGSATFACLASARTASGNVSLSCRMRKPNASPPTPQPKQWKIPFLGLTVKEGVFSPWNGQSPFQFTPAFFRFTKRPTRSTMSMPARISSSTIAE